mgnify:CR=1 FL=1
MKAIKTLENVSLANADEETLNEIRSEAQVMAQLGKKKYFSFYLFISLVAYYTF